MQKFPEEMVKRWVTEAFDQLSYFECRSDGWAFQVGSVGGGAGYKSKSDAVKACLNLIQTALREKYL